MKVKFSLDHIQPTKRKIINPCIDRPIPTKSQRMSASHLSGKPKNESNLLKPEWKSFHKGKFAYDVSSKPQMLKPHLALGCN